MQAPAVQQQLQQVASSTDGQAQLLNEMRKNGVSVTGVQVNQIDGQAVTQPPRAVRSSALLLGERNALSARVMMRVLLTARKSGEEDGAGVVWC